MSRRNTNPLDSIGKGLLYGTLAAVGGWITYSATGINHHLDLPPAINAEQERFVGRKSRFLSTYVDRQAQGRPLVLIHAINAAASPYEMRPLFEHYRARRPVYALDLPGFGFSERANREYSPELYKEAILDLLRLKVKEPADVIALSLGAEFAAMAALEAPEYFHSLTMISPSGFTGDKGKRASQKASDQGTNDLLYRVFSFPLWAQAFYDLLATQRSIHWFLQKSFVGEVNPGMEVYAYLTSHQPGARFAPLYFVSGKLFTRDIRTSVYERLTLPVLVLYDKDPYVNFDLLPHTLANNPNWHAEQITPTRGLPHFEQLPEVTERLDQFWATVGATETR